MMIFERDIAIDLGTTNIRVFVRGKGIMLREPSIVAVDKYTGRMLKVGQDAQKMLGRTPANIVAIHPISAGVISDYDMTALMLKELLSRVTSFSLFKPRVLVTVPSSVTGVEERNVIDAVIEAGARKVYLLETAVATALGAGVDISGAARRDAHFRADAEAAGLAHDIRLRPADADRDRLAVHRGCAVDTCVGQVRRRDGGEEHARLIQVHNVE